MNNGALRAAIRDDDTCSFTSPEALTRVYSRSWDRIPISLAVVTVHGIARSTGIPAVHWDGDVEFPLRKPGLVAFLKEGVHADRARSFRRVAWPRRASSRPNRLTACGATEYLSPR